MLGRKLWLGLIPHGGGSDALDGLSPRRDHFAPRKVALLGVMLMVLMGVVAACGTISTSSMHHDLDILVTEDGRILTQLQTVQQLVVSGQLALEQAASSTAAERDRRLRTFDGVLRQASARWAASRADPSVAVSVEDSAAFDHWVATVSRLRQQLDRGGDHDDVTLARSSFRQLLDTFEAKIEPLAVEVEATAADALHQADRARQLLLGVAAVGLALGLIVSRSSYRAVRAQHLEISEQDRERSVEASRNQVETRIARAFEFARNDHGALRAAEHALAELFPERPTELLMADSSRAHMEVGLRTRPDDGLPGCGVPTPSDCPAVAKGHTLVFDNSERFDSCPYLQGRPDGPLSAVCVPVAISGTAEGVLHSTGTVVVQLASETRRTLELIASRAGDRIGILRAFDRSATQAATDPLTGLANRRSFESRASAILSRGTPAVFAFGDLDHFKTLNDTHGHDTGDRALRTFARTLQHGLRPSDLVARWGGEEFVVAFPDTTINEAANVLERVRAQLAIVVAGGSVPAFTVSFGLADHLDGDDLESIVNSADRALLAAKRSGRDRIALASDLAPEYNKLAEGIRE